MKFLAYIYSTASACISKKRCRMTAAAAASLCSSPFGAYRDASIELHPSNAGRMGFLFCLFAFSPHENRGCHPQKGGFFFFFLLKISGKAREIFHRSALSCV